MEPFKHRPLERDTQELRPVRILEATDAALRLRLHHFTKAQCPRYTALSYTWGAPFAGMEPHWDAPDHLVPITIDGRAFGVRQNLHAALTQLRQTWPDDDTYYWIDALCIDQENEHEKGREVARMGEIYQASHQTIAWLGPEDSAAAIALWCSSQAFVDGSSAASSDTFKLLCDMKWDEPPPASRKDYMHQWLAIERFFDRHWFSRVMDRAGVRPSS